MSQIRMPKTMGELTQLIKKTKLAIQWIIKIETEPPVLELNVTWF
jgi:hypothetical protein